MTGELRGIVAEGKPKRSGGWERTVAIQLLILVVTLGVAEVVLRVIDLRYLRAHRVGAERIYNYDAELGWFPVPNSDVSFTGIRTIRVRHNSLGLRDIEHDAAPKSDHRLHRRLVRVGLRRRAERALHRSAAPQDARPADRQCRRDRLRHRSGIAAAAAAVGPHQAERRGADGVRRQRPQGQHRQHAAGRAVQAVLRSGARRVRGHSRALVAASLLRRQLARAEFMGVSRCGLGLCADRASAGPRRRTRPSA